MLEPEKLREQIEESFKPSDEKEEAEDLPPITKIHIDVQGWRGRRYEGDFVFKVPTLGDQIAIGRMKAAYLPTGSPTDPNAMVLTEQICYLEVTLQKPRPDWWKPFQLYDGVPVSALYAEAVAYERRFHGEAPKAPAVPEGDSKSDDAAGDGAGDQAPVGRKVPPSAERRTVIAAHGTRRS